MSFPYKQLNKELEEKYVVFCLKGLCFDPIEEKYISDFNYHVLYLIFLEFKRKEISFVIDEILTMCLSKGFNLERKDLESLLNKYTNFDNIDEVIKSLKENYTLNNIDTVLNKDLQSEILNKNLIKEKFKNVANEILSNLSELEDNKDFLTPKQIVSKYRQILDNRDKGEKIRSLSYKCINQKAKRLAASGEMSLLFAQKNTGKSIFAENIVSGLISEGVPVVKFGLEMPLDSEMDRHLSIETNIPSDLFYEKNRTTNYPRQTVQIERSLKGFELCKNYLHIDEGALTIDKVENILKKTQEYFKLNNIFKNNDTYMFVVFDLASMIVELAESGVDLGPSIDKFFSLTKKYNCHFFNIVQANENKLRGKITFKTPESLEFYTLAPEDIKNGSAWSERCRQVFALTRPVQMKKQYFPDRIDEWNLEEDLMYLTCIKNNNGNLFRLPFVFMPETGRIYHRQYQQEAKVEN